jgi:hypothetical protein
MAINVLEAQANGDPNHRHQAHHDIESVYWLFVFLALRHSSHNLGPLMCSRLFDSNSMQARAAADAKRNWLETRSLHMHTNAPCTRILHELTALVKK